MKNFMLFLGAALLFTSSSFGQKTVETSFWVAGVCNSCKHRIETALDMKGVKYANYELSTHTLTVAFKSKKVTEDQIHVALHAIGHDTSKGKCSDQEYSKISNCCKYRDLKPGETPSCGGDGHRDHDDDDHDGEDEGHKGNGGH